MLLASSILRSLAYLPVTKCPNRLQEKGDSYHKLKKQTMPLYYEKEFMQ